MPLFSITCTTCKSRLSVRDSGAIGQILACPKCGGMVMVKPPADWQREPEGGSLATGVPARTAAPSASAHAPSSARPATAKPTAPRHLPDADQTATDIPPPGSRSGRDTEATLSESHFDAVDDLLSDKPPRAMPTVLPASPARSSPAPASSDAAASAASLPRGRFAGGSLPAPTKAAAAELATPVAETIAGPDSEEPVDFAEAIAASRVRPRSYWPFYIGASAAGAALAVAVVVAASSYFADRTPSGPIAAARGPGPASPTVDPATASPATSAANHTGSGELAPTPANSASPTGDPAETEPRSAADPPAGPADPAPTDGTPADPATQEPDPRDPPADPGEAPRPPRPVSPFDRLLENDPDPLARPADPPSPAETGSETEPDPAETARPSLPRPPERTVDVAARLADPLPLIEAADTPLVDFLGVLSDFSTIPITLNPDGLPLVQARPTSPINFRLQSTTVGQALRAGIAPYKLALVEEGNQLVVTLAEPPAMRKLNYPLAGLAESEAEAEYLADLIRGFVAPQSWRPWDAGGGSSSHDEIDAAAKSEDAADESADSPHAPAAGRGTIAVSADQLAIQQTMAVHARVFFLLERLRTARGQRHLPYTAKFDPVWLSLATRSEQAASKLAMPVTANFSYGASVGAILKHLESAAGVRILVDWRALAAAGWNPDGEVPFTAEAESLATVLTRLSQSMDLDWRAIDADTLELTTTDALAAQPDLEFYRVEALVAKDVGSGDPADIEAAGQSLVAQLQSDLGSPLFAAVGGPFHLDYDAKSRCLLATLPQAKQRELAEKLTALRGK